jgi:hypothetical protein
VVPNHISERHEWFQAALAAGPGSPERERFWFHPGKGEDGSEIPTHWVSSFQGETWTRTTNADGTPGEWYLHLFDSRQPDLDWEHPEVRAEFEDVLRYVVARKPIGEIQARDLPAVCFNGRSRRLSMLEAAQCDAIIQALYEAKGNRYKAAAALGIARSSLYRKIDAFGISYIG